MKLGQKTRHPDRDGAKSAQSSTVVETSEAADEIDPLLRLPDVLKLVPVSRSTLHRMVRRGEFPRPVKISTNAVGYPRRGVSEFLRDRKTR